ncbi:MAG: hypothetical protein E7233_04155 [Lachnospiraceae bacterium]|nr:hypothetical protein [Lachnospiraceae bacterium]
MSDNSFKIGMCGLCGGPCAIGANLKDGRITSVERLKDHPYLSSDICVRGAALKQFLYHPDRIEHPMKRTDEGFVPVSWEEAISDIAARLLKTREESGAKSTIFYAGHPKWYRKPYAELSAAFGSPNFVTESSTCRSATAIANKLVSGGTFLLPDIGGCDVVVYWSGNQSGQDGKLIPTSGLKAKGKKLIVVDSRKTGVSELADLHLQPTPGTDGALALGIANVIISEGLEDKEFIEKYTRGYEEYKDYVLSFSPEKAAGITGVPEEQIREAAHILTSGKVAMKCSNCAYMHSINGVQNLRAILLLLALTGNLGLPGTNIPAMSPPVKLDNFHHFLVDRPDIDEDISGGEFPVWNEIINNEGQCVRLADVILNEKPYRIRNFIAFGMNTGMWPESDRIVEALRKAEFSVITELFWNEACNEADYVLPACASAERDDVVAGKKNRLLFVEHMIDPGDKLPDVEIILRLAHAMDLHGEFIDLPGYDAYLNHIMRKTGITLDELKAAPDGIDIRNSQPRRAFNIDEDIDTPSGKFEFVSSVIEKYEDRPGHDPLPVYSDWREHFTEWDKYPFILVTGSRKPWYFHSRTFRLPWLANLEKHTCLSICSEDAERLGLKAGDKAVLSTPKGQLTYYVMIDDGLKSGVTYVYHDDGEQNVNRIIDRNYLDPISGFPGFRSYVCSIEKAGKI